MKEWSVDDLRDAFNHQSRSARVVAILSPTCAGCRLGHAVVKTLFDAMDAPTLRGFIDWVPMMAGDDAEAADAQADTLRDPRILEGWDGDRRVAEAFTRTLGLKRMAWDCYLLYAPGVRWEREDPPPPTFWMHQLSLRSGADPKLLLSPPTLFLRLGALLGLDPETMEANSGAEC